MEITPLIFLLQQLRDKRDLLDLPAIQIEYLILDAGEEWGLIPGVHGGVQVVGGLKEVFPALEKNWCQGMSQRGWALTGHPLPKLPHIPPAAHPLPTARHSLCQHVGSPAGSSSDEPRVWAQPQGCSGVLRRGPGPTCCPRANVWLLRCAPLCPNQDVPNEAVPG